MSSQSKLLSKSAKNPYAQYARQVALTQGVNPQSALAKILMADQLMYTV